MIYIHPKEEESLGEIVKILNNCAAITISDIPDFASRGGVIGFIMDKKNNIDKKYIIGFEISKKNTDKINVQIRSQVMRLAKKIIY